MPVRNAGSTVRRAMRSVLDSEFEDFELVIVDDGSTDGTRDELVACPDSRVQLVFLPPRGLVAALNEGVCLCRADCIARMDADDWSAPGRLGRQWKHLQAGAADVVGGRVRVLDQARCPVPTWKRYEDWVNAGLDHDTIAAFRFVESPMVHPSVMARRAVFELGYREGPWPEDYDLWLRAMARGFRFAKLPDHVLDWTDHRLRLTRSHPRYGLDAFDRCRRMHLLSGPLHGVQTVDLWGAGMAGKPWLRWLRENAIHVRHLVDIAPRKIGQTIHGVRVMAPEELGRADGTPLLIAVGAAGARDLILAHLQSLAYVPGRDAWFLR